ncbi:helix-turn-helix transcriptional regulator [Ralstonia sp.]|uniref:helix-turn-helix domain-containing protein n=1 Tax=Ralstonia sp. TaxID=54061 RepID=UPI0031D19CDD
MQLSEFRALLANDGFAATFQTMGQYRTELLRALDGLCAQADARPPLFYYRPVGEDGLYEGPVHANSVGGKLLRDANPDEWKPLYTHPEASAPGLSDQAIAICQEEGDEWDSDRVQTTKNYAHVCRDRIRALTRASAATVAEPSVEAWKNERCYYGVCDEEETHDARCTAWKEAAQQQAEPGADERWAKPISDEMMDLVDRLGSESDKVDPRAWEHLLIYAPKPPQMDVISAPIEMNNWHGRHAYAAGWNACRKARKNLAAQSGQRAGVAEDVGVLKLNPLTPYGMLVRALRIVANATLAEMAAYVGKSPAELSAMEFGRKEVSADDYLAAGNFFNSKGITHTLPALDAARIARTEFAAAPTQQQEGV